MSTLIRFYTVILFSVFCSFNILGQTITAEHFFRKGGSLQDQGDLSFAVDYYSEALKLNPYNTQALFNRALAYYQLKKPRKAVLDLNQLLELNAKDAEAYELRAELHASIEHFDEALSDYSQSIIIQPTVNRYLNRALLQASLNQFPLALQDIDQAIHLNPTDPAAQTTKADILMAMGYVGEAIRGYGNAYNLNQQTSNDLAQHLPIKNSADHRTLLNKAFYWIGKGQFDLEVLKQLKNSPNPTDNAFSFYCMGLMYLRQQEYSTSLNFFNKAIDIDNSLGEYYYARGVVLTYLYQFDKAQQDLTASSQLGFVMNEEENWLKVPNGQERLLDHKKNMATIEVRPHFNGEIQQLIDKSAFLISTTQFEEALVLINQAIHLDPSHGYTYLQKGKIEFGLERFSSALQSYSSALSLNPDLTEANYLRATLLFEQEKWRQASNDLDHVIENIPSHTNALFMRAQCQAELDQLHLAIKDYDAYLLLNSKDATAFNNRGAAKMQLGLAYQALEDFNTGLSIDQGSSELYINRARIKYQMGAFTEALEDYNTALEYQDSHPGIHYEKGLVCMKLNQYPIAIQGFTTALSLDTDSNNSNYYFQRALAYQLANAPEAAIADYNKVLELDVERADAIYNRGIAKKSIQDFQGAQQDLNLAASLGQKSPNEVLSRQD